MKTQPANCSAAVNMLSQSIGYHTHGNLLRPVQIAAVSGAANKSSPEDDEVDRTPDSAAQQVVTVSDQSRLDAWLRLRQPAVSVPVLGSNRSFTVEQQLPDGSTVSMKIRRRAKGSMPLRKRAIGYSYSDTKLQVVNPKAMAQREERSQDSAMNANKNNNVTLFGNPSANKQVMSDLRDRASVYADMNKYVIKSLALNARDATNFAHQDWKCTYPGKKTADRYEWIQYATEQYKGNISLRERRSYLSSPEAYISAEVAANDEEHITDQQVDAVVKRTSTFAIWSQSVEAKVFEDVKQRRIRMQHAMSLLETEKGEERTRFTSVFNTASLLHHAPNGDGRAYEAWLRNHDVDNPVIDSSRIRMGKWSDHMVLSASAAEQVSIMKRLNDERTYHLRKLLNKNKGRANARKLQRIRTLAKTCGFELQTKYEPSVLKQVTPVAKQMPANPAIIGSPQEPVFKTPVVSSFHHSVEEAVRAEMIRNAAHRLPVGIMMNGKFVQVDKEVLLEALQAAA